VTNVSLRVYEPDLVTPVGVLDHAFNIEWLDEWTNPGAGRFTLPHNSPALVADPDLIAPGSMVVIRIDGVERFAWMIERRQRTRGDVWDPIVVTGRGVMSVLDSAVTYPFGGLASPPTDRRLFAWMGHDYQRRSGWTQPTSLGTYDNPTDPSLAPEPGDPGTNEIQQIRVLASDNQSGTPGRFRLNFDGQWTPFISWQTSFGSLQNEIEALPNVDGVTITNKVGGVGDTPPQGFQQADIEFTGANVAGRALPLMTLEHNELQHTHISNHVVRLQAGSAQVEPDEVIEGWPDGRAEWFGRFGQRYHFTRVLDVPARPEAAGPARLFVAGLDDFDVWFDGEHLGSGGAYEMSNWDIRLIEFPHKLALRTDGPIIVSIARMDGDEVTSVLYRSFTPGIFGDSGAPEGWWQYGPGDPHGVTDGYLLGVLFNDAQERGAITPLTRDFDDDLDSNGVAWNDDLEIGLAVGDDSLLDAGQRLSDRGVYIRLGPDLVMQASRDLNTNRTDTVTVPLDAAHELSAETDDDRRDAFLVRYEDGWIDRHEPTWPIRREGFLSLGTVPTPSAAFSLAGRFLDKLLSSALLTPFRTESEQAAPQPYIDYLPGDIITAPVLSGIDALTGEWTLGPIQVDAVDGKVSETGSVQWVTEVTPP